MSILKATHLVCQQEREQTHSPKKEGVYECSMAGPTLQDMSASRGRQWCAREFKSVTMAPRTFVPRERGLCMRAKE